MKENPGQLPKENPCDKSGPLDKKEMTLPTIRGSEMPLGCYEVNSVKNRNYTPILHQRRNSTMKPLAVSNISNHTPATLELHKDLSPW